MADAAEYARWIQANRDKRGSEKYNIVAQAYKDALMQEYSKVVDPTEDMSAGERFLAGAGKAFVDTGRGIGQLTRGAIETVAPPQRNLSDLVTGGRGKSFADTLGLPTDADIAESRQTDAALMNTTGGKVGNFTGHLAQAVSAFFIPGANTVSGAALIGAAQGGLQPTVEDGERLKNMGFGAVAGGGGIILGRAVAGAARASKALIDPFTQAGREKIAGRLIQRFAEDPSRVAAARGGRSATGAAPTLAEETGDAGIARLQDALRSVDPQIANRIGTRLSENNAARVSALHTLAGDSGKREAAEAARTAATRDLYQQATSANYTIDAELADLLSRPAVKAAATRAQNLAQNQGRPFAFEVAPESAMRTSTVTWGKEAAEAAPVSRTTSVLWGSPKTAAKRAGEGAAKAATPGRSGEVSRTVLANRSHAGEGAVKAVGPSSSGSVTRTVNVRGAAAGEGVPKRAPEQITGQGLQDLKMAMDEMLSDPASGFTGKAGDTIRDLRSKLVSWMEQANPEFKAARETFAAKSKPLNGMDVGEEITRRATSATSDLAGNPRMQANALLRMLQDEPALLKAATGRKELKSLDQVFDPNQLALLRNVASETDRSAAVAAAGAGPGSATAQRMAAQNIIRQFLGPTGLPESWAESALANTVIGKPFNLIYGNTAEPLIQRSLADALLDPQVAKAVLAAAQRPGFRLPNNPLATLIANSGRASSSTAAVSGERRK